MNELLNNMTYWLSKAKDLQSEQEIARYVMLGEKPPKKFLKGK